MDVLFAAPMGEAILAGLMPEASGRLKNFVGTLRSLLMAVRSPTPTRPRSGWEQGLAWIHTVSSPGLTLLSFHHKRGIDAICEACSTATGESSSMRTTGPIVAHYTQILDQAMSGVPPWPPPRRKHIGG